MKRTHKLLSLLMALIMMLSLVPTMVWADDSSAMTDEEALQKVYTEFSNKTTYGNATKTPLVFPLEYDGDGDGTKERYTNVVSYMKAWALQETGYAVEVNYTAVPYETKFTDWSSGAAVSKSYFGMDSESNIQQAYFKNNADKNMNKLTNVSFSIGEKISDEIATVYIKVKSQQRTPQEVVTYSKANLCFARIQNGNADADHVVKALGEMSGTAAKMPLLTASGDLYTNTTGGVTAAWTVKNISGKSDALKLASNAITVSRPNVGEENAVFDLTATITSKSDTSVKDTLTHRVTVPAFEEVPVSIQVPEGAALKLVDTYYGTTAAVDSKYIVKQGNAPKGYDLYLCSLHTNATGGDQKFNYTVTKEGYLTKTGTITVKASDNATTVVDLSASTENDAKLGTLSVTAPTGVVLDFSPDKTEYEVTVHGAQTIQFSGSAAVEGATAKITSYYKTQANADKGTLTTTATALTTKCYLPEAEGQSVIQITVTAPAGSTQNPNKTVYTIKVNKASESLPLTALSLTASNSDGTKINANNLKNNTYGIAQEEVLAPAFISGANEKDGYTYIVNYWKDQVTVNPTATDAAITVNGVAVNSGKDSAPISLQVGDNPIKIVTVRNGVTTEYSVNVHRKAELYIKDVTLDKGYLSSVLPNDGSDWSSSCGFNHDAQEVQVTYHTNLSAEEEAKVNVYFVDGDNTYEGIAGQPITIPVGERDQIMPTIWLKYTRDDGSVEGQKYVISLKRRGPDAAKEIASYLPAPGQFVNLESWQQAGRTLNGDMGVTLGALGGNVVYTFDQPLINDPRNPYGIDFIVMGNCFTNNDGTTSAGAAEPAAVMVSEDGSTWYELAGSEYYEASTTHGVSVTYTNSDTTFAAAQDISWSTNGGMNGVLPKNSYHEQAYYPNPSYYATYQNGMGKNSTYSADSVTFDGITMLAKKGFYPFGYADSHSQVSAMGNEAINPYAANHQSVYNGDGFDLAWAVDADGNPVDVSDMAFRYVKVYNPLMSVDSATGEASPEIFYITRAKAATEDVGSSAGLTALSVNGMAVELKDGAYTYDIDGSDAEKLNIVPVAAEGANIYVSNKLVDSGNECSLALVTKTRILVQEGNKAPAIYTLNITGVANRDDNSKLTSLTVTPACTTLATTKEPAEDNSLAFMVDNSVASVVLNPVAGYKKATMTLSGGSLTKSIALKSDKDSVRIPLTAGENVFTLTVTSANGKNSTDYVLTITRNTTVTDNQVRVIVENSTYPNGAWTDTLLDEWVNIDESATMMSCVVDALDKNGYTQQGAESNYITEINGLAAYDGGQMSGWMGTLNDWFTAEGFAAYTVADGTLSAGDEICILYSCDWGADCGSDFSSNDKTLSALTFNVGTLDHAFDKNTHQYVLTVPADTAGVVVTPTASNKNYQVHTTLGTADGTTEYKRSAEIPVANGDVITVKCGDPAWASMNNGAYGSGAENVPAETYTIVIKVAEKEKPTVSVTSVTLSEKELALELGETATLTATVTPANATEQSVTWASDNTDVVTVDHGIITAVAAGDATITATTVDGGMTAVCKVTVTKPENPVIRTDEGVVMILENGADRAAAEDALKNGKMEVVISAKECDTLAQTAEGKMLEKAFNTLAEARKNAASEMAVEIMLLLKDANGKVVAQVIELPEAMELQVPITAELYKAMQDKNICVLRSHTDENGKIVTAELATALAGNEKTGYYITVASDLFSSFMLVSYTGDSSTPDTKDDDKRPDNGNENLPATGDNGVVIYVAVLAVSGVLCAYWITRRKKVK